MRPLSPAQKPYNPRLEDEDNTDSGIEPPEVCGHGWEAEVWLLNHAGIGVSTGCVSIVIDGYYICEESVAYY